MSEFQNVNTKIDKMGGFWSHYKDNSIGRAINYLYHICGLHIAESVKFMMNGTINYEGQKFCDVNWDKGYPHFTFLEDRYNKRQDELLR